MISVQKSEKRERGIGTSVSYLGSPLRDTYLLPLITAIAE